jgi:hypothetical protein
MKLSLRNAFAGVMLATGASLAAYGGYEILSIPDAQQQEMYSCLKTQDCTKEQWKNTANTSNKYGGALALIAAGGIAGFGGTNCFSSKTKKPHKAQKTFEL